MIVDVHQRILELAAKNPAQPALIENETVVGYGEFAGLIGGAMASLREAGVKAGDRVGILVPNSIPAYAAIHAVAVLGGTFVPLPVDDPIARLETVIADAELTAIVSTNEYRGRIARTDIPVVIPASSAPPPPPGERDSEVPLYMLYTSGSTGAPKGVPISESNAWAFTRWARTAFGVTASDRFLAHTRITFDLSIFNLFLPFLEGASVVIAESSIDQMYPGALLSREVSIALLVPRVTTLMKETGQLVFNRYPRLRHLLFCGEALTGKEANPWFEAAPAVKIHNLYGPTEATVACTAFLLEKPADGVVPIGTPLPQCRIDLMDEQGKAIEGAGEGEIVIRGAQVSPFGYWKKPAGGFFDDPKDGRGFRSGDWARRDADGVLTWMARIDSQVKVRGHRVELAEIESILSRHPKLNDCACVLAADRIIAFGVWNDDVDADVIRDELHRLAEERLPTAMRPARFVRVDRIPLNANGKIDRGKLIP